jgi:uncharacterized protein YkwD
MKKYKNRKDAVKTVVAILCAALMLTACGSKETTSNETASTETTSAETTSVESTEITTTEETVAEPTVEPTEAPMESKTAPAESPAPAVEPTAAPVESTAVSTGYTYSELSQTMYAKSAVNVRDLPSTDGKKIGSLKAGEEITVTGKCDQTGWYRFDWNNTTGYVSDKYIVSEKPAVNTVASTNNSNNTAGNTTQQNTATPAATPAPAQTTTTGSSEPYFDRAMAEQVFALVNNDRVANGLNALAWNEDMYNIAVQRCYEGVEGDIHGMMRNGTSENRVQGPLDDSGAQGIYQSWHDSPGHRNNYLNATYTSGAVAIYALPIPGGWALPDIVSYEVFTWDNTATNSSVIINTPAQDNSVAAAPKTADENTGASSSNVGWSMTPPTQEDGLKKWQEQNPDVEVSFGN